MADPREPLGRIVHEQRLAFNAELERPFILSSWEERSARQCELDMRIGSAAGAQAVADAGLVNQQRDVQLLAFQCHLPAVLDALRIAVASGGYNYERKRYGAALEALGGEEA